MATDQRKTWKRQIALEGLTRIAAGDYETMDGKYRIVRLEGVNPPAWELIEAPFTRFEETVFGGCATLFDARLYLRDERERRANGN